MYVCRSCLQRINGLRTQSPFEARLLRPFRTTNPSLHIVRRSYSTWEEKQEFVRKPYIPEHPLPKSASGKRAPLEPRPGVLGIEDIQAALRDEAAPENEDDQSGEAGKDYQSNSYEKKLEFVVRKHLQYLKDPLEIGNHVKSCLDAGRWDEALLMTRKASASTRVEVSWNYLIDHQLKGGHLAFAIKLYNEMKKRGQQPNAKTYTIIFKGCSESIHPKVAVAQATKLYHALLRKTVKSAFEPNTYHLNAVLGVCARAQDLESLFSILATADTRHRAPDSRTFTIVLNALRYQVTSIEPKMGQFTEIEKANLAQESISKAQTLWTDVLTLWRSGKLLMDEQLVVAMGQVLVLGTWKDNEKVFQLLQQVMQVPDPDRITRRLARLTKQMAIELKAGAEGEAENGAEKAVEERAEEDDLDYQSEHVQQEQTGEFGAGVLAEQVEQFPHPGNKTLSLVLKALENTKKTSLAPKYWKHFKYAYKVIPDLENYSAYLLCLRRGHASTQAASVIEGMPKEFLSNVTFRIGLKTCIDDRLNSKSFAAACKILEIMRRMMRYPDGISMRLFLHAARHNFKHLEKLEKTNPLAYKFARGEQFVQAVQSIWRPLQILIRSFSYPEQPSRSPEEALRKAKDTMQEAMATARAMMSLIDVVTNENMAKPPVIKDLRLKRKFLNLLVEQYITKLYPHGPPGLETTRENMIRSGAVKEVGPEMQQRLTHNLRMALKDAEGKYGNFDAQLMKALEELGVGVKAEA
ncbi:hypothetical protein QBC38DRAFT_481447 [Podospora fimiseda]|uniref:Pentatricopeptide repeat protein n=1 Tax=Podospora fimiseda TaxID=252190 RepID=A0AAN7BMJ8_9PEZI|nr:hypothetical protein QBC38DRAFT_481447 [Podospora fimiseda]